MRTKTRQHNHGLRKICPHPRRQWAKCACPWHFNFKWRDTAYRFSLDKHTGRHVDSKSEAEDLAADLRTQIRAGTFGQPAPREAMTLRQLTDLYVTRYVDVQHAATRQPYIYALNTIGRTVVERPTGGRARLGDWRVTDLVTDTIERFREVRLADGTGAVGVNRNVRLLRAVFNWAVRVGYVERTPFKRGTETVVQLAKDPKRARRLRDGEEPALLAASGPHLHAVIVAALESGMRRGEVLSCQWQQIEGLRVAGTSLTWAPHAEIVLPAAKTKTDRRIPISTRLRSILDMRRCDPNGQPLPADAYVFGTAIGTRLRTVTRAWRTAVLKGHGMTPTYRGTGLTAASRADLKTIDLHFHDLRREAGSRWMDAGVPLATIQRWLGHTNVAQTSTYLAGSVEAEHAAMARFEAHQLALQRIATEAGTGGRKRPQSADSRNETLNETAVGPKPTLM